MIVPGTTILNVGATATVYRVSDVWLPHCGYVRYVFCMQTYAQEPPASVSARTQSSFIRRALLALPYHNLM